MTEPGSADELTLEERELATRLAQQRPVPAAAFRGSLARWLAARDPGYGPRPERLRPMVAVWITAGLCLIVAALAVALS